VNLDEPLGTISSALTEFRRLGLPVRPGRWHVLFSGRQRPLLMPAGAYRFQKQCLDYFVRNRLKALYARALLRANALLPAAGLLREFELPRAGHGAPPGEIAIHEPSLAAIQIGSSGPYQKASVLLMSERGDGLALAKIALAASADHMVAVEANWLKELEDVQELTGQVPKLLAEGRTLSGRRYLVISLAPGSEVTDEFTPAHANFLGQLGRARMQSMRFKASRCCEDLARALAEIKPCLTREDLAQLQDALIDCRKFLSNWGGPFVFSQGDFAWWNIRLHEERIFVFDWEYARTEANPLADVFHYHMIERAAAGRAIGRFFLMAVIRRAREIARQLYPEWKWHAHEVSVLALVYVLEILLHYCRANERLDRTDEVIRCYWLLMERRAEWLVPQ
jgi:hypothetical protein